MKNKIYIGLGLAAIAGIALFSLNKSKVSEEKQILNLSSSAMMAETNNASSYSKLYEISSVKPQGDNKVANFTWKENGSEKSFAELTKGKVVFLNFWATWCPPCRKEIPDIIKISSTVSPNDIVVVGVALEREVSSGDLSKAREKVTKFADAQGITYINFFDTKNELARTFGEINSIPTTYIIDRQGKIQEAIVGSQDYMTFMIYVNKYLKK
jgi:cytochrome c-type biogenesis protein